MAVLYNTIDKRNWVYQPNFTRWRHRWRGVRESLKINTEISQFYYDATRLNTRVDEVNTQLAETIDLIDNGGSVEGVNFQWDTDATPNIEKLELPGMKEVALRAEKLRNRIRNLEAL